MANAIQMNPEQTGAWQALAAIAEYFRFGFDLRHSFAQDLRRFERFSLRAPHVFADLSKNLWDDNVHKALIALSQQRGLAEYREKLLCGDVVNETEKLPAIHAALRGAYCSGNYYSKAMLESCNDIDIMLDLSEAIRGDTTIKDVILIGIGGSGLGIELALQALQPFSTAAQRLHVVSNLDGHDISEALQNGHPAHTMFIVVSKSWSTAETLQNFHSAKAWLLAAGRNVADQIVAVTANPQAASRFGYGAAENIANATGHWGAVLHLVCGRAAAGCGSWSASVQRVLDRCKRDGRAL